MTGAADVRVFLLGFLAVAVGWNVSRLLWVKRRSGANPLIHKNQDPIHDFNARIFRIAAVAMMVSILVAAVWPAGQRFLLPIPALARLCPISGVFLMSLGFLFMAAAQMQMGTSWRIGIDKNHQTTLIARGLYRYSRNPIYVGMFITLSGMVIVLANAVIFGAWVVAVVLVPIQVRLEEQHLKALHGESFAAYCRQVRRWF